MEPSKCVAWSPKMLDHFISFLPGFLIPNLHFHILGTSIGSSSFVESFAIEAFHENLGTIFSLLMFADL
jgi:hypothetical protein